MYEFGETPKRLRTLDDVANDLILFLGVTVDDLPDLDLRYHAVVEFLCRVPIEDYRRLKIIKNDKQYFSWFIPSIDRLGIVASFEPNVDPPEPRSIYCKAIYLSPLLEQLPPDAVLAEVALRLAIVLRYNDPHWIAEDEEQVSEARSLVEQWGLGDHLKRLDAVGK